MMARPETERPGGNKKSGKRRCELLMFPEWRNSSSDCGIEADPLFHNLADEITALRAQLAEAEARAIRVGEAVREAAAKACVCTIAERRIDNSLEHERRIQSRIDALKVSDIAKGVK